MGRYDAITAAAIEHLAKNERCRSRGTGKELWDLIETRHPGAIERAVARNKKTAFENQFVGPAPSWAKRYVAKYGHNVSSLTIRQSRTKDYSSGHCSDWGTRLVVTLSKPGSDLVEQQATVLHEIAHTRSIGGHSETFYDRWFQMLRDEGIYRATIATGRFVGVSSLRAAARRARNRRS